MLPKISLPAVLTLLSYLASFPVTSLSITDNKTPSSSNPVTTTPEDMAHPLPVDLPPAPLNDWEHFTYPIPTTQYTLKGRIFTNKRIHPSVLHYMIMGGIASTEHWILRLGDNTHLRASDNPYRYGVPGCHFSMQSRTVRGGVPVMTYGMMRDVFVALEMVLERPQRDFEASFVVVDAEGFSWGHGELMASQGGKGGVDEA